MSVGRIIFLDVDGVLNETDRSDRIATVPAPHMIHPYVTNMNKIALFNHVLKQTPWIKVVVSSTWREPHEYLEKKGIRTVHNLQDFCKWTGLKRDIFHEDWRTPLIGTGENRLIECQAWMDEHPYVFKALAIDDCYETQFKGQSIKLCKTDPREGLTKERLDKVLRYFGLRLRDDFVIVTAGGPLPVAA